MLTLSTAITRVYAGVAAVLFVGIVVTRLLPTYIRRCMTSEDRSIVNGHYPLDGVRRTPSRL